MAERAQMALEMAWMVVVAMAGVLLIGLGMMAAWFVFQPFKWLEAMVRHG